MSRSLSRREVRNIDCSIINAFSNSKAIRDQVMLEHRHATRLIHDAMDAAMIANGTRWPADWSDADKAEMTAKLGVQDND
jgi:hypothetical protein